MIGATGNIGVSVTIAALRSKREVLAVVRNQAAAEKLYQHVGTKAGITTVEADITSDDGVRNVVDMVKSGKLPSFQHVYVASMLFFRSVVNEGSKSGNSSFNSWNICLREYSRNFQPRSAYIQRQPELLP